LFVKPATAGTDPDHVHYRTAQLTLQLAAMVAMADGEFNELEQKFIEQQIAAWEGLNDADRARLHAHMRLMVIDPVTIGSLKKKIQELSKEARGTIAGYMAGLVSTDGVISPDEVRVLEKAYKALGLESANVFSDLHATSPSKPGPVSKSI
jgi:tellurite resistance protein